MRRVQAGDAAAFTDLLAIFDKLVTGQALRRVRLRQRGTDRNDLIQVARIGFWRAAMAFDPSNGTRLATYAYHPIRNHINDMLALEKDVVMPLYIERAMIRAFSRQVDTDDPDAIVNSCVTKNKEIATAAAAMWSHQGISTETPVFHGQEKDLTIGDTLRASGPLSDELLAVEEKAAAVRSAVKALTVRERCTIRRRWLKDNGESFADIGLRYGVTGQAARVTNDLAMAKLKKMLQPLMAA